MFIAIQNVQHLSQAK